MLLANETVDGSEVYALAQRAVPSAGEGAREVVDLAHP